ncbi:uncharacterized protein LOC135056780 [Pseudophryne corroboree]|uniref:uncharacterized protein LOC135056780 n=1 Tax=Pseudophryne corroboree TaxID=495146 RepID=UPI003081DB7F
MYTLLKNPQGHSTHYSTRFSTQDLQREATDPNNSTSLTLEKFLVKLCSHHQKQFIHVLKNVCAEEPLMKTKSHSSSVSDLEDAGVEDNGHACSGSKLNHSLMDLYKKASVVCLNTPRKSNAIETPRSGKEMESLHSEVVQSLDELLKSTFSSDFKEDFSTNCPLLQNGVHSMDQSEKNHVLVKPTEDESQTFAVSEVDCGSKKSEINQTIFSECGVLSHNNSAPSLLNDTQDSEFPMNAPKISDKENTQYIGPKQPRLGIDCKLKQENSLHTIVVNKLGNHIGHCDNAFENFQNLGDISVTALQKVRSHDNTKHSKTGRCKNTPCVRKKDFDKHCDIVYVSEPVTAECNIESQKSLVCPRNTARKSTRGYLFGGDCCELSTVRTLVRSSNVEDKGNPTLHIAEALRIPSEMISEMLPSADAISLVHLGETRVEKALHTLPENYTVIDRIPDTDQCNNGGTHLDRIACLAKQSVDSAAKSIIAVFPLDPEKNNFMRAQTAKEMSQIGQPMDIISEVNTPAVFMDGDSVSVKDSDFRVVDVSKDPLINVTLPNVSVSQEDNLEFPSLDVDITVSLQSKPLIPDSVVTAESPPNESTSLKMAVDTASTSFHTGTDDQELSCLASYSRSRLKDSESFIEDFPVGMIADLDVTAVQESLRQMYPESIPGDQSKDNSEEASLKTLQTYLNCSSLVGNLQESSEQMITENIAVSSEMLKHLEDNQTIDNKLDNCFVEVKPGDTELTSKEPLKSSQSERICSTPANGVLRNCTNHNIFDTCAKTGRSADVKLDGEAVSKQGNCDVGNSFIDQQNDKVEESLETKMTNGGKIADLSKVDPLDSSLMGSKNPNVIITHSKRKVKKTPTPSDRRLRSREAHIDACSQKNSSLQIHILPCTNTTGRSVEFKTANHTEHEVLTLVELPIDGIPDEPHFGNFLNHPFAEGKPLLSERMLKMKCSSTCKRTEKIKICFEMGSNKRNVYFDADRKDALNMEVKESNVATSSLKNKGKFELEISNSFSCAKSSTKDVASKTLAKHEMKLCNSKILEAVSKKNVRQPITFNKSTQCNNQQYCISFKKPDFTAKGKERPKFLDWCSEEENQERISNFNNRYMSLHKSWVPLEKEAANVSKPKNKADKLKEIWKTKKRARKSKNKSFPEVTRCSPMQKLFLNSLNISDICRWFLETTETKSLVIVKKINTRIPEEHQLPIMPIQRHSKESLYPHTLQAERLKKHLKKFASIFPVCNNIKPQNALAKITESSNVELEVPVGTIIRAPNCKNLESQRHTKKQTSARILRKYNNFRENLRLQPSPVLKKKGGTVVNKSNHKTNHNQNIKKSNSKSSLQTATNAPAHKYAKTSEDLKAKKRPKEISMAKHVAHPSKRRKIEAKPVFVKSKRIIHKNSPAIKNEVDKVKKNDFISKTQASKRLESKAQLCKGAILKKRSPKTAIQKHSHKVQLAIHKRQTRSAKQRPIPSNLSRQRITRTTSPQPRKKEMNQKTSAVSKKSKNKTATSRKQRSQIDSATHSKR